MFGTVDGGVKMDFMIYYENVLTPYLDMVVDMCSDNTVNYSTALVLGTTMCSIEDCLYDKSLITLQKDMIEKSLDDFEIRLKGIKGKVK